MLPGQVILQTFQVKFKTRHTAPLQSVCKHIKIESVLSCFTKYCVSFNSVTLRAKPSDFLFLKVIGKGSFGKVRTYM